MMISLQSLISFFFFFFPVDIFWAVLCFVSGEEGTRFRNVLTSSTCRYSNSPPRNPDRFLNDYDCFPKCFPWKTQDEEEFQLSAKKTFIEIQSWINNEQLGSNMLDVIGKVHRSCNMRNLFTYKTWKRPRHAKAATLCLLERWKSFGSCV